MQGGIRIGSLLGIPFFLNPSWFLVLALVTWSYGSGLAEAFPELSGLATSLLGLLTALLLFSSVLAHELGHSWVAQQQGITVKSITLFLFGGLASLEKESETPAGAFWVAIAGPLVSITIFLGLSLATAVVPVAGPLAAILGLLTYINLVLALFNLIPGLPLDGGNILKAVVWKITGKPYKGLAFASRMGQLLGWTAVVLGVLSVLGLSQVGSLWTLLIGWFLLQNAGRTAQSAEIQGQLSGLTAVDALVPDPALVNASLSLRDLADQAIVSSTQQFWVLDDAGHCIGTVDTEALRAVATQDWTSRTVASIVQALDRTVAIATTESLWSVVQTLDQKRQKELVVMTEDGKFVGVLSIQRIRELLQPV